MVLRFYLYSALKNLRFGDPFLVLFLLHLGYGYTAVGSALGLQHLVTGVLELPLGVAADRFGRRRSLALGFAAYALAFALLADLAADDSAQLVGALGVFGVGEALRTGSHKAIMLDWLDGRGEGDAATALLGRTRFVSKSSAGVSALIGGAVLMMWSSFEWLYWGASVASVSSVALILSYPRALDGEHARGESAATSASWGGRLRALVAGEGVGRIFVQSVAFESQVKLTLKVYLQPFFKQAVAAWGMVVLGPGGLVIGALESLRELVGAVGALGASRLERGAGGTSRALGLVYVVALASIVGLAVGAWLGSVWLGFGVAVLLSVLQNARRPVFVAAFNERMDKPQRATSLSAESLARTLSVAAMLPATGALADAFGLEAAFAASAAVLVLAAWTLAPQREAEAP